MKRELATAAARRLACELGVPGDVSEAALVQALAGIALGAGKPADRLRAIELLGRHKGMFRDEGGQGVTLEQLVPKRREQW